MKKFARLFVLLFGLVLIPSSALQAQTTSRASLLTPSTKITKQIEKTNEKFDSFFDKSEKKMKKIIEDGNKKFTSNITEWEKAINGDKDAMEKKTSELADKLNGSKAQNAIDKEINRRIEEAKKELDAMGFDYNPKVVIVTGKTNSASMPIKNTTSKATLTKSTEVRSEYYYAKVSTKVLETRNRMLIASQNFKDYLVYTNNATEIERFSNAQDKINQIIKNNNQIMITLGDAKLSIDYTELADPFYSVSVNHKVYLHSSIEDAILNSLAEVNAILDQFPMLS